jgi:hypothetical protein
MFRLDWHHDNLRDQQSHHSNAAATYTTGCDGQNGDDEASRLQRMVSWRGGSGGVLLG